MKKKNNESISDSIRIIKKHLEEIKTSEINQNLDSFKEIEYRLTEIKKFFKGVRKVMLILLSLSFFLVVLLIASLYYNNKLERVNYDFQNQKVDSLMTEILDIKTIYEEDSVLTTSYKYYLRNSKVLTYEDLSKESDSLRQEYDSLSIQKMKIQNRLSSFNQKLKMAKRKYGLKFIEFSKIENGKNVDYIQMTSPKLDSALILLNEYRNQIFYDEESNNWYIVKRNK